MLQKRFFKEITGFKLFSSRFNRFDVMAFMLVMSIVFLFMWQAKQMATPYKIGEPLSISLDPSHLPFYASRTVVRMLIALFFSTLMTFLIGTLAAKNKRAERILIPTIDVLQSVPILGFQFVVIAPFIALFPDRLLGPECAAIFVIFTSQAWNMMLGFYQTVKTVPIEVKEAAHVFHLNAWQQFWRIEVPYSIPGLLWNAMASMSAGWFFVVAAEAITVSNQSILLPGIGSYIARAIQEANTPAIFYAMMTMLGVVMLYDQLLFRPLMAWAEKFKSSVDVDEKIQESWVIQLFRRTHFLRLTGVRLSYFFNAMVNVSFPRWFRNKADLPQFSSDSESSSFSWIQIGMAVLIYSAILLSIYFLIMHLKHTFSPSEYVYVGWLGVITATRVFILILMCSLIWVPIGVWIGLRPKAASIAMPVAQILSAFPANMLYPLVVMMIVYFQLNPNIWLSPLMILGAQWYILFNVIAGASLFPKDLLQVADNFQVHGWLKWKRFLLPSILPYYVTGAITAAGGAWNASIVAEVAFWGNEKLTAVGLGAYISQYTTSGEFAHVALGIGVMCIWVLIFNRLVWRPLYAYAENRFSLGA